MNKLVTLSLFYLSTLFMVDAEEMLVKLPDGQVLSIDVDYSQSVGSLVGEIQGYCYRGGVGSQPEIYDFLSEKENEVLGKRSLKARDYWKEPNEEQVKAIRFIVLTLGNQPLLKLKKYEGQLNEAGSKIDDVHPLNVWRIIFTKDDTISAMTNIRKRKLVWKKFIKGMAESLQEAKDRQNITDEYIIDFAAKVEINSSTIQRLIKSSKWSDFIKHLIAHVKRSDNGDRYDM